MGAPKRTLRLGRRTYPVILPSWKDPRLHLASVFVCLHTLGQVAFDFKLSIPQMFAPLLTCAVIQRRGRFLISDAGPEG